MGSNETPTTQGEVMNRIKQTAQSTTKFVSKHRVAIAVTITAAVAVKWQMNTAKQWNAFLEDHNLLEEFYALAEE